MKRIIVITGAVLLILAGLLYYFIFYYTKSFSPETNVNYKDKGAKIHVFYNRPSKKGRVIFGKNALVPYGKVWRTGANEATYFESTHDLKFGQKILKAGKYSLWTIPGEQTWTVIFNSTIPAWGVDFKGQVNRNPKTDALEVMVPAVTQDKEFEQFEISIEKAGDENELILIWDRTLIAIPFVVN